VIEAAAPHRLATAIDAGGGQSRLADDLVDGGYRNVSVLDLSSAALEAAREPPGTVDWLCGVVTTYALHTHR